MNTNGTRTARARDTVTGGSGFGRWGDASVVEGRLYVIDLGTEDTTAYRGGRVGPSAELGRGELLSVQVDRISTHQNNAGTSSATHRSSSIMRSAAATSPSLDPTRDTKSMTYDARRRSRGDHVTDRPRNPAVTRTDVASTQPDRAEHDVTDPTAEGATNDGK